MKNLAVLLDDKSIINFAFFYKLLVRYKSITLFSPVIVFAIATYIFQTQNDIYSRTINFKVIVSDSRNESRKSLSNLLGADKKNLSYGEILNLGKTLDFNLKVAQQLFDHPRFNEINLNPIKTKNKSSQDEILKLCAGDDACVIKKIAGFISTTHKIMPDPVIDNKYQLRISSLDAFTTKVLGDLVVEQIKRSRENDQRLEMNKKIEVTKELLEKKKSELATENFASVKELAAAKKKELAEIEKSIESYNRVYMSLKLKLNKVKLTVAEANTAMNTSVSLGQKAKFEKYTKVNAQLKKLRSDLNIVELSASSTQDSAIAEQIKQEIEKKKAELAQIGPVQRDVANIEKFVDSKDKESDFGKFDYNVVLGELKETKRELDKLNAKKAAIIKEQSGFEQKYSHLIPSFEYLKILEDKIVQLDLLKLTIVLDLKFDTNFSGIKQFKRTTLGKICLFAFMITFFLIFIGILFRYILDKRVYDEYEISQNFKGLIIIGNTPDFEKEE